MTRRLEVRVRNETFGWTWVRYEHPLLYVETETSGALRVTNHDDVLGIVLARLYAPGQWAEVRPWTPDAEGVDA